MVHGLEVLEHLNNQAASRMDERNGLAKSKREIAALIESQKSQAELFRTVSGDVSGTIEDHRIDAINQALAIVDKNLSECSGNPWA